MISNKCALLPNDAIPRSVALTYAYVLSKQSARSATPYANSFCRIHMGKSKPKKQDLLFLAECRTDTVPVIMRKLDLFLESNGERRYLVDSFFANSAFPSKALNYESRFESRIALVNQRDNNIQTKNNKAREMQVESIKEHILGVPNRDLPAWVSDNESLSEIERQQCLRHWFRKHNTSDWTSEAR